MTEKKLLIITQNIDRDDLVLGFFHTWVEKLSKEISEITVICLGKGNFDLPQNVKILSLGKEEGKGRLTYIQKFFTYIWRERKNYDNVFVHMNQEYVLLGGLVWKFLGKMIFLWRNHRKGNILTRCAVALSDIVFYTSPDSFTAQFKKAKKMPVGIDVEVHAPQDSGAQRIPRSILSFGRISPVKNIHLVLHAIRILAETEQNFVCDIVGDPVNPEDFLYDKKIKEDNKDLTESGFVRFKPGIPHYKSPELFSYYKIFVNLTPKGSFDKTILEAVVGGCFPIVGNASLSEENEALEVVSDLDPKTIAAELKKWLNAGDEIITENSRELKKYISERHSLNYLVGMLVSSFK